MKNKILTIENSWKFWTLFIIGFITIFSFIVAGVQGLEFGLLYFPIGLLYYLPFTNAGNWSIAYLIGYYLTLISLVVYVVKDKRFNWKISLLILLILFLTAGGCVAQSSLG